MRKHRPDWLILGMTAGLMLLGLVIIFAVGPMRVNFMKTAYGSELSENYFFVHQLINVGISAVAFVVAWKLPYEKFGRWGRLILGVGILLCLALLALVKLGSGLAKCELGACRWINIPGFGSLQPAEVLKLGLVIYLAQLAAERKAEGKLNSSDFWLPVGVVSLICLGFVVVVQKDLGSGAVLVAVILGIIFMSGVDLGRFALVLAGIAVAGVLAIVTSPHRMERVATFVNGEGSDNYHIENALIAIGTGGFAGVGVGNSVQATGYLPESINDSVFAIMGETFGFVGLSLVVLAFVLLLMRILKVVEFGWDEEQRLVASGVFAWILVQTAVNIMAMTGLIPLTGITLPLLSYGGTSMMFVAVSLGLVFQLSGMTKTKKEMGQRRYSGEHVARRGLRSVGRGGVRL